MLGKLKSNIVLLVLYLAFDISLAYSFKRKKFQPNSQGIRLILGTEKLTLSKIILRE